MRHDHDNEDEKPAGRWYAKSFRVGQNAFEFKLDCVQGSLDSEVTTVYFRI